MDIFKIQSLIAQGKIVSSSDIDPNNSYLQIGVYQPGNRKSGSPDANAYAPFAIPLSEAAKLYKYEIGQDVPSEGGIIAHRWLSTTPGGYPQSGTVQNYLVVNYNDIASTIFYSNLTTGIGLTAQSVWDGQSNTNAIITQPGATNGAAFACANLVDEGKNDWYLPAIQELLKIWDNYLDISQGLESAGGGLLNLQNIYWSSTENSFATNTAWSLRLPTNGIQSPTKSTSYSVRPVRKFSI